jgi:hypothetical protein
VQTLGRRYSAYIAGSIDDSTVYSYFLVNKFPIATNTELKEDKIKWTATYTSDYNKLRKRQNDSSLIQGFILFFKKKLGRTQ